MQYLTDEAYTNIAVYVVLHTLRTQSPSWRNPIDLITSEPNFDTSPVSYGKSCHVGHIANFSSAGYALIHEQFSYGC